MRMHRSLPAFVMVLALLLVAGCQNKGPTPKEGAPSTGPAPSTATIEAGGTHPAAGTQSPHAGMAPTQSPHPGMAPTQNPHEDGAAPALPDASGMLDVGAIAFKVPDGWKADQPRSSMRRAQLSAPGATGPAELIVYFFGTGGAGAAQANIDRWIGQFANADGSPVSDAKQSSSKISGFAVTQVELAGRYAGGMNAGGQQQSAQDGQRLIAAIVSTDGGPYYFKFLGPDGTVTDQRELFRELIASIVASP